MSAILTLYLGVMGSGKSYEMTENFILPALRRGQVVATNIYGLNAAAISKKLGRDVSHLIVLLPEHTDQLLRAEHWPSPSQPDKPSTIPRGAVLALDECYKIFPPGKAVPMHVLEYFREQRHFVDDEGRTSMTALAFQDWADVHRSIRSVAAVMFHMSKFAALAPFMKVLRPLKLGFDYRVAVYTKVGNPDRIKPTAIKARRYDPAVFPLYKSYDSADGQQSFEQSLDSRGSLLSNSYVVIFIPIMLLLAAYSAKLLFDRFSVPDPSSGKTPSTAAAPVAAPAAGSKQASTPSGAPAAPAVPSDYLTENLSSEYRLLGEFKQPGGSSLYLVKHKNGYTRYLTLAEVKRATFAGSPSQPVLELHNGQFVTIYSGSLPSAPANSSTPAAAPGTALGTLAK